MIAALETMGFQVKCGENLYKRTHGYAASEQERADDLNAMARDSRVRMVFFGGGEGANELLPLIDYEVIRRDPKIFAGYSDGTTILNAIHAKTGLVTYYGQSPGIFMDLRHYDYVQFCGHFLKTCAHFIPGGPWRTLRGGHCAGILTGGYTRNFALLQGSGYFSFDPGKDYLLFLEDHEKFSGVAEVSSYLSHLEQSPLMERVRGLLFGHYALSEYPDLWQRLQRFGEKHGVPVIACDDFGHGTRHGVLPIGAMAKLDADAQTLDFEA